MRFSFATPPEVDVVFPVMRPDRFPWVSPLSVQGQVLKSSAVLISYARKRVSR